MSQSLFGIEKGIICHQVNCKNAIGGGLSGAIINAFPVVEEKYHALFKKFKGEDLYGKKTETKVTDNLIICNLFTQFDYGNSAKTGEIYTNIEYLINAIKDEATKHPDKNIYIPYNIGCGLGGAKWDEVFKKIKDIGCPNLYLLDTLNSKNIKFIDADSSTFAKTEAKKVQENLQNAVIDSYTGIPDPVFKNLKFTEKEFNQFKGNCIRFLSKDMEYKTAEINEREQYVRITGLKDNDQYVAEYSYKEIYDRLKDMVIPERERYEKDEKIEGLDVLKEIIKDRSIVTDHMELVKDVMVSADFKELIVLGHIKLQVLKDNKGIIFTDMKNNLKIRHADLLYNNVGDYFVERSLVDDFPKMMESDGYTSWVDFFTDICNDIHQKYKDVQNIKGFIKESDETEVQQEYEERA